MENISKEIKEDRVVKPLVFISHDTRDAELAEAFSTLLKAVSAGVLKSFRSSDKKGSQGIEYGLEWYPEIIKNIQEASDVVCLLTPNSVNRPWILFEAGMAKGKLDTPILGIALGIPLKDAITGPFAQFQNCADDEDALVKLVSQLVKRIPNSEPDIDTIRFQVGKFKEKASQFFKQSVKTSKNNIETSKDNSTVKLFEEIKMMFQDLPTKIKDNAKIDLRERRRPRFHPMLIEELCHMFPNDTFGLIMLLSLLKNTSCPWIYDMGIELIKEIKTKKTRSDKEKLLMQFDRNLHMCLRHPYMHDIIEFREEEVFINDALMCIINYMHKVFLTSKNLVE